MLFEAYLTVSKFFSSVYKISRSILHSDPSHDWFPLFSFPTCCVEYTFSTATGCSFLQMDCIRIEELHDIQPALSKHFAGIAPASLPEQLGMRQVYRAYF